MKLIPKYLLVFILIVVTMTIIGLEMDFEIIIYLIGFIFISGSICYLFKLNMGMALALIFVSFFATYMLSASIIMIETSIAYSKITTIPKDCLIKYYETQDINSIPSNKRYAWIGILYRKIDLVSNNRTYNIKEAVGWRCASVFAYFDIEEDKYHASYH